MVQVKEFFDKRRYNSNTRKWEGKSLTENINSFLKDNPNIKVIDIKYNQSTYEDTSGIDSVSCALLIYETK